MKSQDFRTKNCESQRFLSEVKVCMGVVMHNMHKYKSIYVVMYTFCWTIQTFKYNLIQLRSDLCPEFDALPETRVRRSSHLCSRTSGLKECQTYRNDGQRAAYTTLHIINHIHIV